MTLKNILAFCLVIALGVILAVHFILFWIYGGVFIHENNRIILTIETVMSFVIFSFGVERLINSVNSNDKAKASTSPDKIQEPALANQSILLLENNADPYPTITAITVVSEITTRVSKSDYC